MSQSGVFVLNHKTNYTHMYEFLWSTAAISASDRAEPKSGNHQMPSNTPTLSYKETVRTHRQAPRTRASAAAVQHTKGAHMLTRKTAPCSLYLPTDADDRAADECRLTGDERVHVASETMAGLSLGRRVFNPKKHVEI